MLSLPLLFILIEEEEQGELSASGVPFFGGGYLALASLFASFFSATTGRTVFSIKPALPCVMEFSFFLTEQKLLVSGLLSFGERSSIPSQGAGLPSPPLGGGVIFFERFLRRNRPIRFFVRKKKSKKHQAASHSMVMLSVSLSPLFFFHRLIISVTRPLLLVVVISPLLFPILLCKRRGGVTSNRPPPPSGLPSLHLVVVFHLSLWLQKNEEGKQHHPGGGGRRQGQKGRTTHKEEG